MKWTLITHLPEDLPGEFRRLTEGAALYDSSCSPEAKVYFIDRGDGYYLKTAEAGMLSREAELMAWFHRKGLGAEPLAFVQGGRDWLLTRRVPGEDCTHPRYLDDPKRLSETTGTLLRALHETDPAGCPAADLTRVYLDNVHRNFREGRYDSGLFPDNWGYRSVEEAWADVERWQGALRSDTLIHGDYCLPNIMLDNWEFRGFIDVGGGGIGDRHIDLFWGVWTLFFNLKTNEWQDRFLDAYGRDRIEPDVLRAIAAFEVFG